MYHISDVKRFQHCERLYFYGIDHKETFQPYLRSDESINELLIKYLKIDSCFMGVKNDTGDRFFSEKLNYEWFCHPRFVDGDLRINIPFLHRCEEKYDVYFVYYGTTIKELDLVSYRVCLQVLNKLGLEIGNVYIIYFNGDYINDGQLNAEQLFLTVSNFNGKKIKNIICERDFNYEDILSSINNYDIQNSEAKKCKYCRQNGLCEYYSRCFPNEKELSNDSILTLVSSQNKNKMFDEGIYSLKDVDLKMLEGNRVQYAQIMASKNGGLFVDKIALKKWLDKINVKSISFIDFEWDRYLVPPYKNMKPMDVLCFEFALYFINEKGKIEHKTFVGTGDCRIDFIKELINSLPSCGPILAYNADGAEKLRLEELGNMFPEYKEQLENIKNRFVDLAMPFVEGVVYDTRMKGNYTLKQLVDIVSDYSYKDLEIYDGMGAVFNWRNVDKGSEDEEKIVSNLKEYCSLDAYGLLLVYQWLFKLLDESN